MTTPEKEHREGVLSASHDGDNTPSVGDAASADAAEVTSQLSTLEVDEADDSDVWLLAKVPEWLGAAVVMGLTLLVAYGVVMRMVGHGVTGMVEIAGLSMVVIVLLGTAALAMRDGHVRIEMIDPLLKPAGLKAIKIVSLVIQMVVVAVLTYAMFQTFGKDLDRGTTLGDEVTFPRFYLSGLAMVCFAVLELSLVRKLMLDVRRKHDSVLVRHDAEPTVTNEED